MAPEICIDDEVMKELKKRAIDLGLIFEPPNTTLRIALGLDLEKGTDRSYSEKQVTENAMEIKLTNAARKYVLLPLHRGKRHFFPGFKVDFKMVTDVGVLKARVTSWPGGAPTGDPMAGNQIRAHFGPWYAKHKEIKGGDKIKIKVLEPGKCYELSTVDEVNSNKEKARQYA